MTKENTSYDSMMDGTAKTHFKSVGLSKEELLKPRYKVIADYPKSPFKIGDIVKDNWNLFPACPKYPAIFRKLEWWQEREEKDLPEYLIFIRNYHKAKKGEIKKVRRYVDNGFYVGTTESYLLSDKDILPSSKEEYESKIKKDGKEHTEKN